jgi:hypothetical protein
VLLDGIVIAVEMALKGKALGRFYDEILNGSTPFSDPLYKLADIPPSPDPYYTKEYEAAHRDRQTPLIIDNGKWVWLTQPTWVWSGLALALAGPSPTNPVHSH